MQVGGGPAANPVLLVVSTSRFATPMPLPGGGLLVPDPANGVLAFVGNTNALGKLGLPIGGGANLVGRLYVQAVMLSGATLLVSNAVQMQIGV